MAQQEDQERTAGAALTEAKMEGYLWKSWLKKAVLLERLRCIGRI